MNKRNRNYRSAVRAYRAQNYAAAYKLLIGFAKKGDAEAQTMIGSIYQLGLGNMPINEAEAIRWYLLASEQGYGLASNNLGTIAFMRGNKEEAARYYAKARAQNFPHAPEIAI